MTGLPAWVLTDQLTRRQRLILAGLARGRTLTEIETDLQLSYYAVRSDLGRLARITGTSTGRYRPAALVHAAYRRGWLHGLAPEPRNLATLANLGERNLDCLVLAAEGLEAPQIADRLFLSHTAVKSRLQVAYRLLGARNCAHAIALMHQHHLMPTEGAAAA